MSMIVVVKGTLFVDIDGTLINAPNEEPLPFAVEKINKAYDDGYMIVVTTMRGTGYTNESRLSCPETLRLLKTIGLKYHEIIWNCPSPRIIINDEGAVAINHPCNSSWEKYQF